MFDGPLAHYGVEVAQYVGYLPLDQEARGHGVETYLQCTTTCILSRTLNYLCSSW